MRNAYPTPIPVYNAYRSFLQYCTSRITAGTWPNQLAAKPAQKTSPVRPSDIGIRSIPTLKFMKKSTHVKGNRTSSNKSKYDSSEVKMAPKDLMLQYTIPDSTINSTTHNTTPTSAACLACSAWFLPSRNPSLMPKSVVVDHSENGHRSRVTRRAQLTRSSGDRTDENKGDPQDPVVSL